MSNARVVVLSLLGAALAWTSASRADVLPRAEDDPGHRVHVIDRTAIEGRTIVAVGVRQSHGDHEQQTRYVLVDDFPVSDPRRICAVPSEWVIDSPVGALGPRMLRGARAASGALTEGNDAASEVETLFDQPDVACASIADLVPDAEMHRRHVEAVEDTMRVVSFEGTTLRLELVEVTYQLADHSLVTLPATNGTRPTLASAPAPVPPRGCACAVGRTSSVGSIAAALAICTAIAGRLRRRRAA